MGAGKRIALLLVFSGEEGEWSSWPEQVVVGRLEAWPQVAGLPILCLTKAQTWEGLRFGEMRIEVG